MSFNLIHRTTIGETGKTMHFWLYDTDPVLRVPRLIDLTDYTVKIRVRTADGITIVDWVTCDIDPDQTTNTGEGDFSYNATVIAYPNLVHGDHHIRFELTAPDMSITYIPKRDNQTYGIFRVLEA